MASFAVETLRLTDVQHHPNADRLDIAVVGPAETGYHVVVGRDQYKIGDLVCYMPEAALLPAWLVEDLGLTGILRGPDKNRIKCVRLRGEISQGLVWAPKMGWDAWFKKYYPEIPERFDKAAEMDEMEDIHFTYDGYDITEKLGITKWVPDTPSCLGGDMEPAPEWMKATDSENTKKVGRSIKEDEIAIITEKVHGTQMSIGTDASGKCWVSSKGVLNRGGCILSAPGNDYWRCFYENNLEDLLDKLFKYFGGEKPVQIIGEAYGKVQDLKYDNPSGPLKFLAFDMRIDGRFLGAGAFLDACVALGVPMVPLLFVGPYSVEKMLELTDGKECVSGKSLHMREGVVVKPLEERVERWGRCSVKSVSTIYLMRNNGTELE